MLNGMVQGNQFGRTLVKPRPSISIVPNKSWSIGSAVRVMVGIARRSPARKQGLHAAKQRRARRTSPADSQHR